jgi:transcriptional regulator with XRE-family HTH domain
VKQRTFFSIFAGIVKHSGLTYYEIARRTNEYCSDTMYATLPPVNRVTVSRIARGIDLPQAVLLYRIAFFGLAQSEEQWKALEQLRRIEARTHTTSHHKVPSTDELRQVKATPTELREA